MPEKLCTQFNKNSKYRKMKPHKYMNNDIYHDQVKFKKGILASCQLNIRKLINTDHHSNK